MLPKALILLLHFLALTAAAPTKRQCSASKHESGDNAAFVGSANSTVSVSVSGGGGQQKWHHSHTGSRPVQSMAASDAVTKVPPVTSATTSTEPAPATPTTLDANVNIGVGTGEASDIASTVAPTTTQQPIASEAVSTTIAESESTTPPPAESTTSDKPMTTGSTTSGGEGGAVGLAWNSVPKLDTLPGLQWYYNWATTPSTGAEGLEFVPQIWGRDNDPSTIPSTANHVLSFNEPDQPNSVGGSGISPADAATLHKQWTSKLSGSPIIGSPATARGGKKWMQDWISACGGACKFDFVAFHFYGTNADDLIAYAEDYYTTFNKPLWLTEWSCKDFMSGQICNAEETEAFMNKAITYFRGAGKGKVERWAWFGAFPDLAAKGDATGLLDASGAANAVGKYYVSL